MAFLDLLHRLLSQLKLCCLEAGTKARQRWALLPSYICFDKLLLYFLFVSIAIKINERD